MGSQVSQYYEQEKVNWLDHHVRIDQAYTKSQLQACVRRGELANKPFSVCFVKRKMGPIEYFHYFLQFEQDNFNIEFDGDDHVCARFGLTSKNYDRRAVIYEILSLTFD